MTNDFLTIELDHRVAIITLDHRGASHNTLSTEALDAIERALREALADPAVHALVIMSGKPDSFVVGADVEELRSFTKIEEPLKLSRRAHALIQMVRNQDKPTVAAIHGPALGGGLELALACSYRIASHGSNTHLGLPEVRLGLIPGGGGTQLLPRLIGLQQALPIMLTGKNVYPQKALQIGLVDSLTHTAALRRAAIEAARQLSDGRITPPKDRRTRAERALESTAATRRIIYRKAREQVLRETRGHFPAPLLLLDVVQTGIENGLDEGLLQEAATFSELVFSEVSQELVYLFFAQRQAQKNPWDDKAASVRSIGILGGGLMGGGIAALSAERGLDIKVKDVKLSAAATAKRIAYEHASKKLRKKAISSFERDIIVERVRPVDDYAGLSDVDLIIEAVPEDIDIKHEVLAETEAVIRDTCIIASNTSSIPIATLAKGINRPDRILGMHYFSPVPQIPLLEIIRTESNPDEVVATAVSVGLKQGKTVIVVNDSPGFYTTRILAMYMNEAVRILEEGGRVADVDSAMKDLGFPMGPFELFDMVGIDVAAKIQAVMDEFVAERGIRASNSAKTLVDAGLRGRKSEKGFYEYRKKNASVPEENVGINKEIYSFFRGTDRIDMDPDTIQQRLVLVMVNEAALCLQEGVLNSAVDGDIGAVFGLGFPPFLGGPFRYIDRVGASEVVNRLKSLRSRYGEVFTPAPIIVEKADSDQNFHS